MKGRLTGISLLFCFVVPMIATYTSLHFQKQLIRKEVKRQIIAGIDKSELFLLKFTKQESHTLLKWKHNKEFEYQHEMFDVVETETCGDTLSLWCWRDSKETKLSKQLDKLLDYVFGHDSRRMVNQKRLSNFYKSLYCEHDVATQMLTCLPEQPVPAYHFSLSKVVHQPPAPPPKQT